MGMISRLASPGCGIAVLAAVLAFPAGSLAGTKVSQDYRYVPADPYTGQPALECVVTTTKKYNFFGSKSRAQEQCYPARRQVYRPRYRPRYQPQYEPDSDPGYDPNQ